jgi:hypothetical protein
VVSSARELPQLIGSGAVNPVAHAPRLRTTISWELGVAAIAATTYPSLAQYPPRGPYPQQEECPQGRQLRQRRYFPPQMTDCQVLDADTAEQGRLRRQPGLHRRSRPQARRQLPIPRRNSRRCCPASSAREARAGPGGAGAADAGTARRASQIGSGGLQRPLRW